MDMFGGNKVVPDFEYQFETWVYPRVKNHFKKFLATRLLLRFYPEWVWNMAIDIADLGWGVCSNQVRNRNNPLYWADCVKPTD